MIFKPKIVYHLLLTFLIRLVLLHCAMCFVFPYPQYVPRYISCTEILAVTKLILIMQYVFMSSHLHIDMSCNFLKLIRKRFPRNQHFYLNLLKLRDLGLIISRSFYCWGFWKVFSQSCPQFAQVLRIVLWSVCALFRISSYHWMNKQYMIEGLLELMIKQIHLMCLPHNLWTYSTTISYNIMTTDYLFIWYVSWVLCSAKNYLPEIKTKIYLNVLLYNIQPMKFLYG